MEKKIFKTSGVCAREITFDYENGCIYNVAFTGGCNGNLKAIATLIDGKPLIEVQNLLKGNTCNARPTSCGDQLAQAIGDVL